MIGTWFRDHNTLCVGKMGIEFNLAIDTELSDLTDRLQTKNKHVASLLPLHPLFNRQGRWGTTDDSTTSFLYFSLLSPKNDSQQPHRLKHSKTRTLVQ